jgi:hypothetical protein
MCVTYEELTSSEDGEPVINYWTLASMVGSKRVIAIKRGGGEGSRARIVYNSLPEKYRKRFEEKYGGNPEELYNQEVMKEKTIIRIDPEAAQFFSEVFKYKLNGVLTPLDDALAGEYAANASVLNMLLRRKKDVKSMGERMNNHRRDVWEMVQLRCEHLRYATDEDRAAEENPLHSLPKNLSRLKERMREYDREMEHEGVRYPYNYRSLISRKIGNRNTLKITEEAGELLLALKRCMHPVFTDRQIFERFNEVELPAHNARIWNPKERWKPLKSLRGMVGWLNRPENVPQWYGAVHGELKALQRYGIKLNTELAGCRDARWEGDGTKLNLYYRENGKRLTCTVYEVMDTYSEALLGYWISDGENYMQQYHAFRMAVQQTRRSPYEIVTDNQGGAKTKKMQDFIHAISHIGRVTKPNNPQSKSIESAFGRYQAQVLHQLYGYTGQNVTSKKESSKPNLEFIEANTDKLPTLAELKERYIELREMWNGLRPMLTTGKLLTHPGSGIGRMEMYLAGTNELAPEVTAREMAESFWLWTDKPVTFRPDGIEIKVENVPYKYDVFSMDEANMPDVEWRRRNTYRKFWVKYDPYDMSAVKLYWEDAAGGRRYERVASPPVTVHRAIQDQREGERAYINRILDANRQEQAHRFLAAKEIEWKHGVAPEQNGLHTPRISGLSAKENAEVNQVLERRVARYRNRSIAQANKDISMMTYDEAAQFDESENEVRMVANSDIQFDRRRAAEKI